MCNAFLYSLPGAQIKRLHRIQSRAASLVVGVGVGVGVGVRDHMTQFWRLCIGFQFATLRTPWSNCYRTDNIFVETTVCAVYQFANELSSKSLWRCTEHFTGRDPVTLLTCSSCTDHPDRCDRPLMSCCWFPSVEQCWVTGPFLPSHPPLMKQSPYPSPVFWDSSDF